MTTIELYLILLQIFHKRRLHITNVVAVVGYSKDESCTLSGKTEILELQTESTCQNKRTVLFY